MHLFDFDMPRIVGAFQSAMTNFGRVAVERRIEIKIAKPIPPIVKEIVPLGPIDCSV